MASFPPQKFREILFLLLFSEELHSSDPDELIETVTKELKVRKNEVKAAWEKLQEVTRVLPEIDSDISAVSTSYDFHRIQKVELAVLRLSCYELLFEKKLAAPIVIAEAKRIAKKFATPDAAAFCQALLDSVVKIKALS